MADKDISLKQLEAYPKVFADIVNVLMFDGKKVVNPDALVDANIKSQYKFLNRLHEEERDVAKFCQDGNIRICMMGLENQTTVDKDMPLRVLAYDGAMYRAQLLDKKETNRYPVITIVLYFGEGHWKAPRKLTQCLNIPEAYRPFLNEYKIKVYEIAHLPRETIDKFESDFRMVAEYYWIKKHSKDLRGLDRRIEYVDAFIKTMAALTGDNGYVEIFQDQEIAEKIAQGGVSVCEILERMRQEGRAEGEARGEARGRIANAVENVKNMMDSLKWTAQAVMDAMKIPAADRPAILAAL